MLSLSCSLCDDPKLICTLTVSQFNTAYITSSRLICRLFSHKPRMPCQDVKTKSKSASSQLDTTQSRGERSEDNVTLFKCAYEMYTPAPHPRFHYFLNTPCAEATISLLLPNLGGVDGFGVERVLEQSDVEVDWNVADAGYLIAARATRQKMPVCAVFGIFDCHQSVALQHAA